MRCYANCERGKRRGVVYHLSHPVLRRCITDRLKQESEYLIQCLLFQAHLIQSIVRKDFALGLYILDSNLHLRPGEVVEVVKCLCKAASSKFCLAEPWWISSLKQRSIMDAIMYHDECFLYFLLGPVLN